MQILQWLFKVDEEKQAPNSSIANEKEFAHHARDKKKDIMACSNRKSSSRSRTHEKVDLDCKDVNKYLASLVRRGNFRTVFHSTLYVYRPKVKREATGCNKLGSTDELVMHQVGNRVLPVSDSDSSSMRSTRRKKQNEHRDTHAYSSDRRKGDGKTGAVSRMKELLRWSEAAKSQKGQKHSRRKVLHTGEMGSVKGLPIGENEFVRQSSETSFRCDMEICSTIKGFTAASVDRPEGCDCGSRKGNWITTDDEFVVLEL